MKKEYIVPTMEIVRVGTAQLMAGSLTDEFDPTLDFEKKVDTPDVLSVEGFDVWSIIK